MKTYLIILTGFLSLTLTSFSSIAQSNLIAGKIMDSKTSEPIEFAVVKLINTADSVYKGGAITDENGFFKIDKVPFGSYRLKLMFIGYQTKTTQTFSLNEEKPARFFRRITLEPSNNQLKEVSVSGEKSFVKQSIDRKTYSVQNMAISRGSTVSEILEIIPSVDVDIDGNISLRGSSNLTILIDGKPTLISGSDLQSLLETLPANSIQKIEVITNPSAKYDPDGMAGIINIVTKKNKLEGFFGNINIGAAYNGRYNAGGMLSIKQGKWSTMLNLGVNYSDRFSEGTTYRRNLGDTVTLLDQISDGNRIGLGGRAAFSLGYQINKSSSVTLSSSWNIRSSDGVENIRYSNSVEDGSPFSLYNRDSERDFNMNFTNYKLDYQKDFKGKEHNLKASAFVNQFQMNITSAFEQGLNEVDPLSWSLIQQRNITEALIPSYIGQIDYTRPIGKGALELGAKSINKSGRTNQSAELYDSTTGAWMKETQWSNEYQIDEGIHSAYAVFKQQYKKLGYQIGLRLEKAFTDAFLIESNEVFHNEYFSPFPTLHLSYSLPKGQQLKASYSRRVNRPSHRAMRPFPDYSDPLNIRQGNPFLVPEFINSYELEYEIRKKKTSVNLAGYFKEVNGLITRIKTVDDEGVATTTFKNLGTAQNFGLEFIFNSQISKKWRMTLSSNAYQTTIDNGADSELNAEGYMISSKLLTSYKLPYSITLQLSGRYSSPRILPQGEISAIYFADLALQKRLLKNKATLNLKITDMFNTREFSFITSGTDFYQDSYRKRESRFFQLSFMYNFGEFKPQGRRRGSSRGSSSGGSEMEGGVEID